VFGPLAAAGRGVLGWEHEVAVVAAWNDDADYLDESDDADGSEAER
jgi:hypothetical protein